MFALAVAFMNESNILCVQKPQAFGGEETGRHRRIATGPENATESLPRPRHADRNLLSEPPPNRDNPTTCPVRDVIWHPTSGAMTLGYCIGQRVARDVETVRDSPEG